MTDNYIVLTNKGYRLRFLQPIQESSKTFFKFESLAKVSHVLNIYQRRFWKKSFISCAHSSASTPLVTCVFGCKAWGA